MLRRLPSSYPKSSIGILAQAVQDRKEWLVIRASFHPQDTFDFQVNVNFLYHDVHEIPALLLSRVLPGLTQIQQGLCCPVDGGFEDALQFKPALFKGK